MRGVQNITGGPVRITVHLGSDGGDALAESMRRHDSNITSTVNTALVRNNFFEEQVAAGRSILIENENGELERVHLL